MPPTVFEDNLADEASKAVEKSVNHGINDGTLEYGKTGTTTIERAA